MSTIKATWKNGQIQLDRPADWPEGRRLEVREVLPGEVEFATEDEQPSDPEGVKRWMAELDALPASSMTPEQEAEMTAWREKAKAFNLEAVRRPMEEGIS